MATLARFKRAGFSFVSATAEDFPPTFEGVKHSILSVRQAARDEADWLVIADSVAQVEAAWRSGKLALGFNVQDTIQIGTEMSRVGELYELGVRHMLLAYNTRNHVADGCAEVSDAGLSNFGRRLVKEMNRVGMIVDCSHTGRRSSVEAMELSEGPCIFSHSGVHEVCAHIRNVRDDQIRACAAGGGAIGVVGIGAFLGDAAARAETMFRHIDHIATLVGPEHVGIGSDYVKNMAGVWRAIRSQKETAWPDPTGTQLYEGECVQPEQLGELIGIMLSRGYPVPAVKGILGNNFKRVYQAAERARAGSAAGL
jgi:membrane dipeptidase